MHHIPLFFISNDCIKTKKNSVFDNLKSLQLSASKDKYSSGFFENVFAKLLTMSILVDDMVPGSDFCNFQQIIISELF